MASTFDALVADGLFLESGYFFVVPKADLRSLRELFRAHVLKMLAKEDLIDENFIKMIKRWQHVSGFNVYNQVRIKPDDEHGIENLSQYIFRNTFSLGKLKFEAGDSSIINCTRMTHGKNKRNFQVFSPLEFVASVTQHIPQLMWREYIKKIWEVDPLTCIKCSVEMGIISFVYKKEGDTENTDTP